MINYVVIDEKKYILRGNGRLSVGEDLGIQDQFVFKEVELPFLDYKKPEHVWDEASRIPYNIPRGKN